MKKIVRKLTALLLAGVLGVTSLTACKGDDSGDGGSDGESSVKKIYVGTPSSFEDDAFYNEQGELDGFEIELLKAIDDLLEEYEFEYEPAPDMANVLLGLDNGSLDMGAHQFEYSDERNRKYLFGTEGYLTYKMRLTVLIDNNDVNSLEDLAGKTVGTPSQQSAVGQIVEKYNADNPDKKVNIEYYGSISNEAIVESFKQGKWDAIIKTQQILDSFNSEYSEDGKDWVKQVGDPINDTEAYFLFTKNNTELQKAVDGAIKELKANGKLSELSKKWFGKDYTPAAE